MKPALVILCGGNSLRMGTDKALLPFGEECLLEYLVHKFSSDFDKIYLSVTHRGDYAHLNLDVTEIPDIYHDVGPLGGILSSLSMITEDRAFFISLETPFLSPSLCLHLYEASENYDAATFDLRNDYTGIVAATYSKKCLSAFGSSIVFKQNISSKLNEKCMVKTISFEEAASWATLPIEEEFYRLTDKDSYYFALFKLLNIQSK